MIVFREFETKTGGQLDALDVTEEVVEVVTTARIESGTVLIFSPHTTCCVLLAPPGRATVGALQSAMDAIAPPGRYYAHDDLDVRTENLVEDEPANAPAHITHAFMGATSQSIPIVDGRLVLGDGQRILFVELDCSRERRYFVQAVGQ